MANLTAPRPPAPPTPPGSPRLVASRPGRTRSHPVALAALAAVGAVTTLVALLTWEVFTQDFGKTLIPLLALAVIVAGSGMLARWWRVPKPFVVLIQVLLSGMVASTIICGSPIPIGGAWTRMTVAFTDAVTSSNHFAPPVPSSAPPVHPLLIAGGLACLLLVDVLACSLRRVPLAGLPLLTIFSVPVSMTGDGPSWFLFALTAVGFLSMLFLSESEQVARWGPLLAEDHGGGAEPKVLNVAAWPRTGARAIGGVATVLALAVPLLIPTFDVHVFNFGPGAGGDDDISIENPTIDLRRDLLRGDDIPLVTLTTKDPDPSYLRIAVLNRFTDREWSSGDREVPSQQTADGQMPALVGVSTQLPRQTYDYSLQATRSFSSTWLPTSQLVSDVEAPGDWRYDTSTMDFLASDDNLDTSGLSWDFTAVKLDYDPTRLADAPPVGSLVPRDLTDVPNGLPPIVRTLTRQVTADASSRFEKAVALQQWFRQDGGFVYDDSVDPGNGTDDLVRFLTKGNGGRRGYCEQFAAAFALMARELGIPARVSIGFLSPTRIGDDTYQYSAHDLHAWPELFFSGSGWVRFEPTPATRANGVPSYTTQPVQVAPEDTPSASASAQTQAPRNPSDATNPQDKQDTTQQTADTQGGGFPVVWVVAGGVLLLLLLAALLLTPRTLRARRRDQAGQLGPEEAWAELRDTALDLRLPWPYARSPRQTRDALVRLFGAADDEFAAERPRRGADTNPDAVAALDRLVTALERLRYARADSTAPGTWRAEMQSCVAALYGGATRRARRRAVWWPASVFTRRRPVARPLDAAAEPAVAGRVVDHVG